MPKIRILLILLAFQFSSHLTIVDGLVEDVIDIIYLGREVIKTISSTWELADKLGVNSDIELPFMKRKEKKIFSRLAEITQEFRKAEMTVRSCQFLNSTILKYENVLNRFMRPLK